MTPTTIMLDFETKKRTFADGGEYRAIRLECWCRFYQNSGCLGDARNIIIDTGALLTTLPHSIWSRIAFVKIGHDSIGGINPEKNARLTVDVAQVGLILLDRNGNHSNPIVVKAYLIPKEYPGSTPVIGFSDLLEKFKIVFDYRNESAYLSDE